MKITKAYYHKSNTNSFIAPQKLQDSALYFGASVSETCGWILHHSYKKLSLFSKPVKSIDSFSKKPKNQLQMKNGRQPEIPVPNRKYQSQGYIFLPRLHRFRVWYLHPDYVQEHLKLIPDGYEIKNCVVKCLKNWKKSHP